MTRYVMEAVENYDATQAALLATDSADYYCYTDQMYSGFAYDPVRRRILYNAMVRIEGTLANDSGFTLWNGTVSVAPAADFSGDSGGALYSCVMDIDTKLNTWYPAYSAASLVPAGIGGGDGTWRRFTDTGAGWANQGPRMVDPRTGNLWMHAFGNDLACSLYLFRAEDDFAQIISPLGPFMGSGHMTLRGIVNDWAYVESRDTTTTLLLSPREITSDETAADYLLSYADFAFEASTETSYYGTGVTPDGSMYLLQSQKSGTRDYKLFKFTQPTSAPYGGPVVGGGWTDVTPWASGDGPNTDAGAYTLNLYQTYQNRFEQNIVLNLPADPGIACITKLFPRTTGSGVTDPTLLKINCTYFDLATGFDYHDSFITGYMTADWQPTLVAADAAWSVLDFCQVNTYLDTNDYAYDEDYAVRSFFVTVQPVVGGVWTPDTATNHIIIATYRFVYGSAPELISFVPEAGWDANYTTYATAISNDFVVASSMATPFKLYEIWSDSGVYDATTNAYWWSGNNLNMYQFNPAWANRADVSGVKAPPFLRLSTVSSVSRTYADLGRAQSDVVTVQGTPPATLPTGVFYVGFQSVALGGDGGPYTYSDNGTLPPGLAINATSGLTAGTPLTDGAYEVTISATDGSGRVGQLGPFTITVGIALAPVNLSLPVVSGTPAVDQLLTVTNGTWANVPTSYAWQWRADGSPIMGETNATYTVVIGDVGALIDCVVTATNDTGSTPATSNSVGPVTAETTKLAPSSQWTGVSGSGFGGSNPAKPTPPSFSAIAPSCRPIFIQHTFVTGVDASDGSDWVVYASRAKGGVASVRIWCEGNYVDVTERRWISYTDVRGTARLIYGFAAQLDYDAAQATHPNGSALVVAQAFANDGTMVAQVSPDRTVHFRPGAALTAGARYTEVKTVGSGGDYSTLPMALDYVCAQAVSNPTKIIGLKIISSGFHSPEAATSQVLVAAHATEIFANTGVTAKMGKTTGTSYCTTDGTRFYGPGIVIDTVCTPTLSTVALAVSNNLGANKLIQGVGIEVYTGNGNGATGYSGSGGALLYNGYQPYIPWLNNLLTNGIGTSHAEWKDIDAHDMSSYGFYGAESIINVDLDTCSGSGFEGCYGLIHGGSLTAIGGYQSGLRQQKPMINITYGGVGTASYSVTTTSNGSSWPGNGSNGYLNLYVNGSFVKSFSTATYGNGQTLSNAINAYGTGFSCTYDATYYGRSTAYLSHLGLSPTDPLYPAVTFTAGVAAITTIYDIHADCIVNNAGTWSNVVAEYVTENDNVGTAPFSNEGTSYNFHYGNLNCADGSLAAGIEAQRGYLLGAWHHVGYEDITVSGYGAGAYIGNGTPCDAYTFFKNAYFTTIFYTGSAFPLMSWQGLVVNIGSLPSGANSGNYSSVQSAPENTFINLTSGVPVLDGDLKNSNMDYCCALVPSSLRVDSPTGNYGWNITG